MPDESHPGKGAKEASTKLLLDQLSNEYKILQDKIDKIGAFKFTIRGWSLTLVVATCIGATTAKLPSPRLLWGLVVFVVVFLLLERTQNGHQQIFGRRCAEVERLIWRVLREQGCDVPAIVPRIAHELADEARIKLGWWHPRARASVRWVRTHSEYAFYVVQIVVIVWLAAWLPSHPKRLEPVTDPPTIQYNVIDPSGSSAALPTHAQGAAPRGTECLVQESPHQEKLPLSSKRSRAFWKS